MSSSFSLPDLHISIGSSPGHLPLDFLHWLEAQLLPSRTYPQISSWVPISLIIKIGALESSRLLTDLQPSRTLLIASCHCFISKSCVQASSIPSDAWELCLVHWQTTGRCLSAAWPPRPSTTWVLTAALRPTLDAHTLEFSAFLTLISSSLSPVLLSCQPQLHLPCLYPFVKDFQLKFC